jgi:hypothetical protein
MCRKAHGAGYATYGSVPAERFHWLDEGARSGEESLRGGWESSPGSRRCFCTRCGSVVPGDVEGDQVFFPLGNFDDDPRASPELHIFVGSQAPWHVISDALPQHAAYPPEWGELPTFDAPARSSDSPAGAQRGSCLCGAVVYEVAGDIQGVVQCHCSRCRKSRSAAHGANLFFVDAELAWKQGRDLVRHYKVPHAESFTSAFCKRCGSLLPRDPTPGRLLGIPAGSLDTDPGVGAKLHIFVGSKAPWVEISDDLPMIEGRPGAQAAQSKN